MILAATPWLSISINLLLVVFVVICLLMTVMILMQRPKQEGLGAAFGAGMTDQMFGARTTNVLQRGTVWFASLFFILALTLAILIGKKNNSMESLVVTQGVEETEVTETTNTNVIRNVTVNEDGTVTEGSAEQGEVTQDEITDSLRSLLEDAAAEAEEPAAPVEETTPESEVAPEPTEDQPADSEENPGES